VIRLPLVLFLSAALFSTGVSTSGLVSPAVRNCSTLPGASASASGEGCRNGSKMSAEVSWGVSTA